MATIKIEALTGAARIWPDGALGADKESQTLMAPGEFTLEAGPVPELRGLIDPPPEGLTRARLDQWIEENSAAITEAIKKGIAAIKAAAAADMRAPAVGSASAPFRPAPGRFRLTVESGAVFVRVYNAQNPEAALFGRESVAYAYIDASGNLTDSAWQTQILVRGQSLEFDTIEANAITVAFYGLV